ncbi:MAG: hypothetical protein HC783_05705 [Rhodobacteraceae bacterium]|nr:hypothetical protein [Paracoccaceae bacterium]
MRLALAFAFAVLLAPAVHAACKQNFTTLGLPLLSQIEYRTFETYKGLGQTTAAKRIAARLKAEGYAAVRRSGGVVTALQDTSGSGRPQELRFIVSEKGGKTMIEAIFTIQQGQVAGNRVVRNELCRLIATAAG